MNYLAQFLNFFGKLVTKWGSVVGVILISIFALIRWVVDYISSTIVSIVAHFAALIEDQPGSPDFSAVADILTGINTFIPLNEIFALLVLLGGTWILAVVYRLVKSWIPTLA